MTFSFYFNFTDLSGCGGLFCDNSYLHRMKRKPVLITLGIVALFAIGFFFVRGRFLNKPQKADISQFINHFTESLATGKRDSVIACFETNQHQKLVTKLVNIFSGKTGGDGKSEPLFGISLDAGKTKITMLNSELAQAVIPVYFTHDSLPGSQSVLILKIRQSSSHACKIVQLDALTLFVDMAAYEKKVKLKGLRDEDLFSPITLASFKTAKELRSKYDTVLWFQHIGGKTYYFVAKGAVKIDYYDAARDNNIGLLSPALKEIIPPKYDLVHNVNGTVDGLIEVEKADKRGFYDIDGKNVVPVEYDQILPLTGDENLALLRKDNDYFYLKNDKTISDKIADLKITDEIKKIKNLNGSFTLEDPKSDDIMERNDRDYYTSIVLPPSYLVDLGILPKYMDLQNHLRKQVENDAGDGEGSEYYKVSFDGQKEDGNWLKAAYYSVVDSYLGSRSGLYETKNILVVDKHSNKMMGFSADSYHGMAEGGGPLSGKCNDNSLRQINDTLFEFKTTAVLDQQIQNDSVIYEGPYYHYLHVQNGKLIALPNERLFGFTKYVKMDDGYLMGCYIIGNKDVDHMTTELLQYAKNEIYANYHYKFKSEKWSSVFQSRFGRYDDDKGLYTNVDDSLTDIDKYNINWITQKLKGAKATTLAAK